MASLIERIRERVADPLRVRDAAAWVRPLEAARPPASPEEVAAAEASLGFRLPPLLRRLYLEVANGGFGPANGLEGVPSLSHECGADIVVLYKAYARGDPEEPRLRWPYGLVPLVDLGCNIIECVSCIAPPHPILRLDPDRIDWDRPEPIAESLLPVAPSFEGYLEAWLTDENTAAQSPPPDET
jgi:hypothetical protein